MPRAIQPMQPVVQARRVLFSTHGWIARWGAVAAIAALSVIAGLCMVALFITPEGVSELSTPKLLGMAGLFLLPAITPGALHWERRSRGLVAIAFPTVEAREPEACLQPLAFTRAIALGDTSAEEAQLSAELDRVLPWIMPDPASPRTSDPQRHRRRVRPGHAEAREFYNTGRE